MSTRPDDTPHAAWLVQRDAIRRMEPSARVSAAIDISDSVRDLRIQGLLQRNPQWRYSDAVQWLIQRLDSQERRR